jgi:hypothetical protein
MTAAVVTFGCSNTSSSSSQDVTLSGNWQFVMSTDGSFASVNNTCQPGTTGLAPACVGGFLLQKNGSVTGQVLYSLVALPQAVPPMTCGGAAPISGTVNGQSVKLTASAGNQTFSLTGNLSADGKTMAGTYSLAGQGCGTAQSGMQWTATLVPSLSGSVQGSFYSTTGSSVVPNERFSVSGSLAQGPNIGAGSATITGNLNFQNYPCASTASVNGEISGNTASLQVFASNGSNIGTITPIFVSTPSGYVLSGSGANGYSITTTKCPSPSTSGGDVGNVCLAMGNLSTTATGLTQFSNQACTQPLTLTPPSLSFPAQLLGTPATSQSITLTNTDPSGATLTGLSLSIPPSSNDFNALSTFTEQDNCAGSQLNTPFDLGPQQSCTVTVSFAPQQSCPWVSSASQCQPFHSNAQGSLVTVQGIPSAINETSLRVPISGTGVSILQPSIPELDFGAESPPTVANPQGEASAPQSVTFTNQGNSPVQILPTVSSSSCGATPGISTVQLPRPLIAGLVSGIQIVSSIGPAPSSVSYACDVDSDLDGNPQPDFPIVSDGCSGQTLATLQSCTVSLRFQPGQRAGQLSTGLHFFMQLNTLQCTSSVTTECEIDAGRFPVELKTSPLSPLRVLPSAGINFGFVPRGEMSLPVTITLFNDPQDPAAQTITFTGTGNPVSGDFTILNGCGASLAPGSSCTMTVTFAPTVIGFDKGSIAIGYKLGNVPGIQTIFFRGMGE